jgi:hypothetical protein
MRPAARLPQRAEAVAARRHQAWIESPEPARAAAIDLVGGRIPTPIVPGFAVLFTS